MATGRAKRQSVVVTDFPKAFVLAEQITEPRYRCKSLAVIARFAPEDEVKRVADRALTAARLEKNAYWQVISAAWPVCALAERGEVRYAAQVLSSLLEEAKQIDHPVSYMGALASLFWAAWTLPAKVRQPVLDALLAACHAANSWKAGSIMKFVALAVAVEDRAQAERIVDSMRDSVYKRQAKRRLEAEQLLPFSSRFPDENATVSV